MVDEPTLIDASLFPRLVVTAGGQVLKEISLRKELSIGRAEDNDLQLPDPKVSRHHSRIRREGATYVVTDLGSANGTLVDGVRLSAPHTLKQGERVSIGDTDMVYLEPGQAFQDTITAPLAVPGARGEERQRPTRAAPPPMPAPEPEPAARGTGRGVTIALALVGAVLLLALVAVVLVLLIPDLPQKVGLVSPPTATMPAAVASPTTGTLATAVPAGETPAAAPTATSDEPVSTVPAVDDAEMNDLLSQAEALVRRSKFEDAIVIYESLSTSAPGDARPEIGWAWALIYDDQPGPALDHARRAAELDPGSAAVATVLARAYVGTGDAKTAVAEAQKAVQIDAASAEAHAALAEAYLHDGQDQAALDEADLALVQDINCANAHRIRGWIYQLVDNDMGRAAGELQIAAGLQPELWLRRHELGLLLMDAENYNTAIIAFQDALGIRPKAVTYTAIGEAYYHLGQYDQAKASLQQALSVGADDADTYSLMAASLAHLERCDEAQTYIDQALILDEVQPLALEAQNLCQNQAPTAEPTETSSTGGAAEATEAPAANTPAANTPAANTPAPTATTKPASPPAAVSGRIAFPVWNPDTSKYDTYVAKADGTGQHLVVDGMHQPAFSPNGEWLAVNGEKSDYMNMFIIKPDGSSLRKITDFIEDALASWSPDSKGFVLTTTRDQPDHPQRLYVIDDVPFTGHLQPGRMLAAPSGPIQGDYPTWTPDNQIVYKGCDYTVLPQECGLFITSVAGGGFTRLTKNDTDTAPAVAGGRIAFMSTRDGNWEIYIMNESGGGVTRLTNNAADDGLPAWSPDGKTLAFVSNQGGPWAVWAMSPDGSNRRKLFDLGGNLVFDWEHERISWAP